MLSKSRLQIIQNRIGWLSVGLLVLMSCTPTHPPIFFYTTSPETSLIFPPQTVMVSGDFAEFRAENERALQECPEKAECDEALFNLGFLYAYIQSPYRDLPTALGYLDQLIVMYPQSPWAFQGRAWVALIHENLALEESRRQLQADFQEQQDNLRAQEAKIQTLQTRLNLSKARLNRARAIDIEMEKKARELLR